MAMDACTKFDDSEGGPSMLLRHQQSSRTREKREPQNWGFIVRIKLFLFYCFHICVISSLQSQDLFRSQSTLRLHTLAETIFAPLRI